MTRFGNDYDNDNDHDHHDDDYDCDDYDDDDNDDEEEEEEECKRCLDGSSARAARWKINLLLNKTLLNANDCFVYTNSTWHYGISILWHVLCISCDWCATLCNAVGSVYRPFSISRVLRWIWNRSM